MGMHLPGGLAGWRWMYVAEALPAIVFGVLAWFYFPDRPADATWIRPTSSAGWRATPRTACGATRATTGQCCASTGVMSALLWFCLLSGAYGIMFWLPQMLKQLADLTPLEVGFVNALPWVGLALGHLFQLRPFRPQRRALPARGAARAGGRPGDFGRLSAGCRNAGLAVLFIADWRWARRRVRSGRCRRRC